MLMWNCLEDLDSFKRLILGRFGSNFEGWRGLRVVNADKDELPATYSAFCWASRALEVPTRAMTIRTWSSRAALTGHLYIPGFCWCVCDGFLVLQPKKTSSKRNSWKASPTFGWKMLDLINPEYEVESQCRKGRSSGMKKFMLQKLENHGVTPWKMEFEQKSHIAHMKARSWDHDATTQLEPKNNARRSSTISTVGV